MVLFLDSRFRSAGRHARLTPVPHGHDYCSCVASFEIGRCESSSFVLSQDRFDYLGPLNFHVNFGTSLSVSIEKPAGMWVCAWSGLSLPHENRSHGSTLPKHQSPRPGHPCVLRRRRAGEQLGGPVRNSGGLAGPRRAPECLLLSLSPHWLRSDRYCLILFSQGKALRHREVQ